MSLLYDAALLVTIGLVAWNALDVLLDPALRRRLQCVAVLALAALVWTAGELLLQRAETPGQVIAVRRVLFAGVCVFPAAWVWTALVGARPAHPHARRIFLLLLVPSAIAYACLWLAPGGAFLDWVARPPRRGPLFYANAFYSWVLIAAGAAILLRATWRHARAAPVQLLAVGAGVAVPLLANAVYVLLDVPAQDPTPIALGLSAVVFRVIVVDLAWAAHQPPLARAELVDQMRDGVLVADLRGRVVDWNASAAALVGLGHPEGWRLDLLVAAARRRGGRALEVREFPLRRRRAVFGTGVVMTDRSARREAEMRLELATRLEALGYLAAGAAHEINNPLSVASANLALLEPLLAAVARHPLRDGLPPPLRDLATEAPLMVADAREGTLRVERIVAKLGQFGRGQAAEEKPGEIDLRSAVERAVAMVGFGKRQRPIDVRAPRELPRARAVEGDVLHVVFHLLLNAMQIGGEDVPIDIELEARDDALCVRVLDEGPGIRPRDLPHVFEPFFTTRRPGAHVGLGLSLCWELARRNAGRLEVANRPEGGAVFTLWLPPAV